MSGNTRIGPPKKYGRVLASLADLKLYSSAMVACLYADPQSQKPTYLRAKAAINAHAKRHGYPEEGDGQIASPKHRTQIAWFGWRWKENLEPKDLVSNETDSVRPGAGRRGTKMKYGDLFENLSPHLLYAPETIAKLSGEARPHPDADGPNKNGTWQTNHSKVLNALQKYRDAKLPGRHDGFILLDEQRVIRGWFGWRWLVALPEYLLSAMKKETLEQRAAAACNTLSTATKILIQVESRLFELDLPSPASSPDLPEMTLYLNKDGSPNPCILLPDSAAMILQRMAVVANGPNSQYVVLESVLPVDLGKLNPRTRLKVLRDIAAGLADLHSGGSAYGWLSPRALVASSGTYKLARKLSATDLDYLAPELVTNGELTPAADVFAIGRLIQTFIPESRVWRQCLADNPNRRPSMTQLQSHLQEPQTRRFSRRSIRKVGLVAGLFLCLLTFGVATQWSPIRNAYWMLNHEGPGASYQFLREVVQTKKADEELLYTYAWSAYRNQKYEQSEELCRHILSFSKSRIHHAYAFNLLGYLLTDTDRFEAAKDSFDQALNIYQELGDVKNTHRSFLGIAKVAILENDLATAEFLLNQAEEFSAGGFSLETFYRMKSWLAFKNGDYQEALGFSQKVLAVIDQAPGRMGTALSGVGLYTMLTGQIELGFAQTQKAEVSIIEAFNKQDYYYNLINKILYARCTSADASTMTAAIARYLQQNPDRMLDELFQFVLQFDCRVSKADPIHPDPPNDGQPTGGGGGSGGGGKTAPLRP